MKTDDKYKKVFPVSWDQFHGDAKALAWRLAEGGPYKGIVIITRGGLAPAAILARELDVKHIDTLCVSSYDWQKQGESSVLKAPCVEDGGEGWLLVDDLVDTGRTAKLARRMLPRARFAVVYAKPAGRSLVDDFVAEVSQDAWILFPWDSERQFVTPIVDRRS